MSQPEPVSVKTSLVDDMGVLVTKAFKELDATRSDLQEKERRLMDIEKESMKKIEELSKINHDLQDKIGFLLDLSASMNKKNDELVKTNLELEQQKAQYSQMTLELKTSLDSVMKKEKELSLQKELLIKQVDDKTNDLLKSEKFRIIGELSARLAHDLRNPLSVIKNTADILRAKPHMKIEEKLQHFARFDRAIHRMMHQIDDVLNFVKKTDLTLQSTSVIAIIDNAIANVMIPSGVTVHKPLHDLMLICDGKKMDAVFSNMILNAVQALNEHGDIYIRLVDLGNTVKIEFEDTGLGVLPDIQSKIFEPLFTTKQTGTGLGLSICKSIIEQHGGMISAKFNPTVFAITMPKLDGQNIL